MKRGDKMAGNKKEMEYGDILELLTDALEYVDEARNIGILIEETGEYDDIIYPIEKIESLINDVMDIVENELKR